MSLPGETHPGRKQLQFFSSFVVVMLKRKTDENGAFGYQQEDSKTHTTDFQREISDECPYIVKSLLGVHHTMVMYAALNSLLFMSACMTLRMRVLLSYQNMCIMLKVQ